MNRIKHLAATLLLSAFVLFGGVVDAQDVSRIFLEAIDDSTTTLRFGRYRIELRGPSDTATLTPTALLFPASVRAVIYEVDTLGLGGDSGIPRAVLMFTDSLGTTLWRNDTLSNGDLIILMSRNAGVNWDTVYTGVGSGGGTTDSTRVGYGLKVKGTVGDSIAAPADTIYADTSVLATKGHAENYADTAIGDTVGDYLNRGGGQMTGNITMAGAQLVDGKDVSTLTDIGQTVGTSEIENGAVTDAKIDSLDPDKLEQDAASTGQVLKWNGTAWQPGTDNTAGASADSALVLMSHSGTYPFIKWLNDSTFIAADSIHKDTLVFMDSAGTWLIDGYPMGAYTNLGQTIEGDELGAGLKDSITDGQTAHGWADHSVQGYITDSKLSDSSIILLNATAWRLFYSNATPTAIQELVLGGDGTYLKSQGTGSMPIWDNPPGATWVWADSAGEPKFWVDSAKYADLADSTVGVETGADVTDATNVNAAGAVMESDFNATTFLYATTDNTPQPKTPSEVRSILNVEDGATADQTDAEIEAIIGPFVDTTTLDTIQNAHKAVAADSAGKALQDAGGNTITTTYETIANVGKIGDDTTNFKTAFGWGDHSTIGYENYDDSGSFQEMPKSVINTKLVIGNVSDTSGTDSVAATHGSVAATYETIANVGLIGDDTTNFKTAYGWGNHSTVGYENYDDSGTFQEIPKSVINTELYIGNAADTNVAGSLAVTVGNMQAQSYLTSETDPVWTSDSADYAMKTWIGPFIDTTSTDTIEYAHKAVNADTAAYSADDFVDPYFSGDVTYTGSLIGWQRRGAFPSLDSLNIDLPDSGQGIIIHNWIVKDTGGSPLDSIYCCWGDSLAKCTVVTHPSVTWADNGIFGDYDSRDTNFDSTSPRGIIVITPYNLGSVCENPCILATHGEDSLGNFNWRSWGSDTTQNPFLTPYELDLFCADTSNKDPNGDDYSPYKWNYFSDAGVCPGHKKELWVYLRARGYDTSQVDTPTIEAIWLLSTDGSRETSGDDSGHLVWSDPTMIFYAEVAVDEERALSPFILQFPGGKYRMWLTRNPDDTANYMWIYETDGEPDAEYWDTLGKSYIVDNDTIRAAMSNTLLELWHPNALMWSPNKIIGLFSYGEWNGGGGKSELYVAESDDGGWTWRVRDSVFLPYDSSGDSSWFDVCIYRAAAWWNIYPDKVTMDVFWAGKHTGPAGNWDIGHAETYWTQAAGSSTDTVRHTAQLTTVTVKEYKADDSVILTAPLDHTTWSALTKDSALEDNYSKIFYIKGWIPWDMTIDTVRLKVNASATDSVIIESYVLYGPSLTDVNENEAIGLWWYTSTPDTLTSGNQYLSFEVTGSPPNYDSTAIEGSWFKLKLQVKIENAGAYFLPNRVELIGREIR